MSASARLATHAHINFSPSLRACISGDGVLDGLGRGGWADFDDRLKLMPKNDRFFAVADVC